MDLKDIGKKRQKKRKETDLYKVKEDASKPKFYVLDMFPYPSGAWLHVWHPKWYIASDTLARKKMLEGFNVLHPMGFDTFGLGTENYAIEHKMKPQDVAKENIATYIKQLEMFGTTYDRSRSVNTADPEYFKRTQRVFLQLFNHYYDDETNKAEDVKKLEWKIKNEKLRIPSWITEEQYINSQRLAYVDYKPINRCPSCMTGLANEDLDDGKCERCGSQVEQKPMKQWVLRITKYAERLLEWLDGLKREESMKDLERNWIGKSEGTQFKMKVIIPENGTENAWEWKTQKTLSKENNDWTYDIIGLAMKVHRELWPGLQEKIYQKGLEKVLKKAWYKVETEKKVQYKIEWETIWYWSIDILVNDTIAIELKSRKILEWDFYKQLRTYINQSEGITAGLLINFYNGKLDYKRLEKNYLDWKQQPLLWNSQDNSLEFGVYTTRIDTVFWMSFVSIAPEHPLLAQMKNEKLKIKNWKEIEEYQETAKRKTQLERTELQKDKTGVEIKWLYAINPFNNQQVPIFVADYVLANYGTWVVMAVPAHDERDFEFAKKYDLPIVQSIMPVDKEPHEGAERRKTISAVIHRKSDNKFLFLKRKKFGWVSPVVWGIEGDEDPLDAAEREVLEETWYKVKAVKKIWRIAESNFFADNKNVRRQRIDQPVLLELVNDKAQKVDPEEFEKHEALWLTYEEAVEQTSHKDNLLGLTAFVKGETAFGEYGRLINSWEFSGLMSDEAIKKIQARLEKKWTLPTGSQVGWVKINYKMQDRVFSRQRYRWEPFPVLRTNDQWPMSNCINPSLNRWS